MIKAVVDEADTPKWEWELLDSLRRLFVFGLVKGSKIGLIGREGGKGVNLLQKKRQKLKRDNLSMEDLGPLGDGNGMIFFLKSTQLTYLLGIACLFSQAVVSPEILSLV